MNGKSTIDLSDLAGLAEPATALINRVSDAVGGIAKPWQIKRVANAESEAAKIIAAANVEVTEIEERGLRRLIHEQARSQENIESITRKAIPHLNKDSEPNELEEDFVRNLFDKASLTADEDMQQVWAKILAGETNAKGTYSKRSLSFVADLERDDALLFSKFCSQIWYIGQWQPIASPFTGDVSDQLECDLNFHDFLHLESIGLITFNQTGIGLTTNKLGTGTVNLNISYAGLQINLEIPTETIKTIPLGKASLSTIGKQLLGIADGKASKAVFDRTVNTFIKSNICVSIPVEMKQVYEGFDP